MNDDKITERGVYGCLAIVLFSVLSIVVSVAVGVFFEFNIRKEPLDCVDCHDDNCPSRIRGNCEWS